MRSVARPGKNLSRALPELVRDSLSALQATRGVLCLDNRGAGFSALPSTRLRCAASSTAEDSEAGRLGQLCSACRSCAFYHSPAVTETSDLVLIDREPLPCGAESAVGLAGVGVTPVSGVLAFTGVAEPTSAWRSTATAVARRLAFQLQRLEIHHRLQRATGRDLLLLGTSDAMQRVDDFLDRATRVTAPVLMIGERGVEKETVAYALHFGGPRWRQPFVKVSCAALDRQALAEEVPRRLAAAVGGTLYLQEVDDLEARLQPRLSALLDEILGLGRGAFDERVRVVASSCRSLTRAAADGAFYASLATQLEWLSLSLAPLRERREDIPELVEHLLHLQGFSRTRFSGAAYQALMAYAWPGNVVELRRTLAHLALACIGDTVEMADLVRHAPMLVENITADQRGAELAAPPSSPQAARDRDAAGASAPRHPALERALVFMAKHLDGELSLATVARSASVSPSHLSYLFRRSLGRSFKPFLVGMRLERARRLLRERPHATIVSVADAAGFGDLSHFERTFKRHLGLTPRDYRRLRGC